MALLPLHAQLGDVEEMLAQRGIEVSYETIRYWDTKFGPKIATNLRRRKAPPCPRWRLDEMVSTIGGDRVWIWRDVDDEGEVMDMIAQKRRDTAAASTLLRRLLRNRRVESESIVTDGLRAYPAALEQHGLINRHRPSPLRDNSSAENSHLSIRHASSRSKASRAGDRRSVFSRRTQPSTTRSTCSGIC